MQFPLILKPAKILAGPHGRDPRVKRTLYFFAQKGFLNNSPIPPNKPERLSLKDVLWTCATAAPELLEILPVARLRFPNHLPGPPPEDLARVLAALKTGAHDGPDYQGHPYWRIRGWADLETYDRRSTKRLTARAPRFAGWRNRTVERGPT